MRPAGNVTRREVLKGVAAGSIAMPTIVPSSVFGRDGRTAPSERITVGFIGCGKMANDYHLSELLKFGDVQALAVCEVDQKRREHAKKRVEKAYEGKNSSTRAATPTSTSASWSAQGHRRRLHRHSRALARDLRHRGHEGRQGRLLREAADPHTRGRQAVHRRRAEVQASFPDRQPAAIRTSSVIFARRPSSSAAAGWARSRPSPWAWAARASGATCRPGHGARPGLGSLARPGADAALQFHSQPAREFTTIFRPGASIANTAAAATPTWAHTTTISPSGAWAWTSQARWRFCRPGSAMLTTALPIAMQTAW